MSNRKLTWDQVVEIRTLHAQDALRWSSPALAKRYGVCRSSISNVIHGRTWTLRTPQAASNAAKLTDDQVRECRHLWATDRAHWTQKRLADRYGIAQSNINRLVRGLTYPDVT